LKVFVLLLLFAITHLYAYEKESTVICAVTSKIAKFTQKNNPKIKPYTISVLHNRFGNLFKELFKDIQINGKDVQVSYIEDIYQLKPSNILFIFDTPPEELKKILIFIKGKHILTMSTMRGFAQRGGMVQIYVYNQKLKLNINLQNVKDEGIYINSALLRIVHIIKGRENE